MVIEVVTGVHISIIFVHPLGIIEVCHVLLQFVHALGDILTLCVHGHRVLLVKVVVF